MPGVPGSVREPRCDSSAFRVRQRGLWWGSAVGLGCGVEVVTGDRNGDGIAGQAAATCDGVGEYRKTDSVSGE